MQRVDNAFHFVVCDCEPSPPQAFQCRRNIVAFSVRQSSNSKTAAKPKFDSERLELLKQIAVDRHGVEAASQSSVTLKIQAVQKAVKREKEARAKNPEKKD